MSTIFTAGTATMGAIFTSDATGSLQFQTGSTPTTAATLDSSGNLLLGTTTGFTSTTYGGGFVNTGIGIYPYSTSPITTNSTAYTSLLSAPTTFSGTNGASSVSFYAVTGFANSSNTGAGGSGYNLVGGALFNSFVTTAAVNTPVYLRGISVNAVRSSANDLSTVAGSIFGIQTVVQQSILSSTSATTTQLFALLGQAYNLNGTITQQHAGVFSSIDIASGTTSLSSTSATAYNFLAQRFTVGAASGGPGVATVGANAYLTGPVVNATGTISTWYGVYLGAPTITGTITTRWAIYSADTGNSFFAGNIGIGTTTPSVALDVVGSIKSSSLTSGRVTYATTGGLLTDSANLTFNGTTLTANTLNLTNALGTAYGGTGLTSFTANGVVYASSTSALATGSALTFDGTNLGVGGATLGSTLRLYAVQASGEGNPTLDGSEVALFQRNYVAAQSSTIAVTSGSSSTASLYLGNKNSIGAGRLVYDSSASALAFYTSASEQMRLTSTGLGIGTSSPAAKLDVVGNGIRACLSTSTSVGSPLGGQIYLGDSNFGSTFSLKGPGIGSVYNATTAVASDLAFYTYNSDRIERMRITSAGNVGIGTTSPTSTLSVTGTLSATGTSTLAGVTATSVTDSGLTSGRVTYATTGGLLTDSANLQFDGNNLGIGVTPSAWYTTWRACEFIGGGSLASGPSQYAIWLSSNAYLNTSGNWIYKASAFAYQILLDAGNGGIKFNIAPGGTAGGAITFTQAMTLNASGYLGIGQTSPAAKLDVINGGVDNGSTINGIRSVVTGANTSAVAGFFSTSGTNNTLYSLKTGEGSVLFGSTGTSNFSLNGYFAQGSVHDATLGNVSIGDTTSGYSAGLGGDLLFRGDERGSGTAIATFANIKGIKENSSYLNSLGALVFGTQSNSGAAQGLSTVTEKMRITSAGYVGIGTTSPSTRLVIDTGSTTNAGAQLLIGPSSGTASVGDKVVIGFKLQNTVGGSTGNTYAAGIGGVQDASAQNSGALAFYTQYAASDGTPERMRIDNSGNVGIGTTSPSGYTLHVSNSTPAIRISNTSETAGQAQTLYFGTTTYNRSTIQSINVGTGGADLAFLTAPSGGSPIERMRITSAGYLGIGTTSPAGALDVIGRAFIKPPSNSYALSLGYSSTSDFYYIGTSANTTPDLIFTNAAVAERMRLTDSGNLGIGTTSPNISGQSSSVKLITVSGTGTSWGGLELSNPNSSNASLLGFVGFAGGNMTSGYNMPAYIGAWLASGTALKQGGELRFFTQSDNTAGATERMRITSTGFVGIGTTSPTSVLYVCGSTDNQLLRVGNNNATNSQYISIFCNNAVSTYNSVNTQNATIGSHVWQGTNNAATYNYMTLDGSGNLGIGTASPGFKVEVVAPYGTYNAAVTTQSDVGGGISITSTSNGTNSRVGLFFRGSDNIGSAIASAREDPGSTWRTYIAFYTNNSTGVSVTSLQEKMRLTSDGNLLISAGKLGIGQSAPVAKLHIGAETEANLTMQGLFVQGTKAQYASVNGLIQNQLCVYDDTASTAGSGGGISFGANTGSSQRTWIASIEARRDSATNDATNYAGSLVFYTRPAQTPTVERMRIDSSGNLMVGTTTASLGPTTGFNVIQGSGVTGISVGHVTGSASGSYFELYAYNGSGIGAITQSGTTAVLYNTTSDQRLKENIQDADSASNLIDSLQVRQFDWKSDNSHQRYGFIAQELVTVAPEAVHQPADTEEMMGVDYSKLVPMLVKEIQSLRARVAQLETKGV